MFDHQSEICFFNICFKSMYNTLMNHNQFISHNFIHFSDCCVKSVTHCKTNYQNEKLPTSATGWKF